MIMNHNELTGIQVQEQGSNKQYITITVPVRRIIDEVTKKLPSAIIGDFKNRGKYHIKYQFSNKQKKIRASIPKVKLTSDKILYNIAQHIQNSCQQISRFYSKLLQIQSSQNWLEVSSYDVISCDFSIVFPEYQNRKIFFRLSNLEFNSEIISQTMEQQIKQKIAFSYNQNDFYNSPCIQQFNQIFQRQEIDWIKYLKMLFSMTITLYDLHYMERLIDRRQFPDWHQQLFNHFLMKIQKRSTLIQKYQLFVYKVIIQEGQVGYQIQISIDNNNSIKNIITFEFFQVYQGITKSKASYFKSYIYNFLIQIRPEFRNVLVKNEVTFGIKVDNRQYFEAALLSIYKYLYFYSELFSCVVSYDRNITTVSIVKSDQENSSLNKMETQFQSLLPDKIKINLSKAFLLLKVNFRKHQFQLEGVTTKCQQNPADISLNEMFQDIFGKYIENMLRTVTLRKNLSRKSFSSMYNIYATYYYECSVYNRGKFNLLLKKIFRRLTNQPKPNKFYSKFWIEYDNKQDCYDLLFSVYEILFKPVHIANLRIHTNFDYVWSAKEKIKIQDLQNLDRDLRIDELLL